MAKKDYKNPKYLAGRELRIATCKKCNGNPNPVPFELEDFTGTRCSEESCMEILTYESKIQPKSKKK